MNAAKITRRIVKRLMTGQRLNAVERAYLTIHPGATVKALAKQAVKEGESDDKEISDS